VSILIALIAGLGVGAVLGLLGAGGSLLTVPALAILLGLTATEATGTSLVVVAAMAVTGLFVHRRAGRCSCREGAQFAAAGVITAAGAGALAGVIPDWVIAISFAALLVVTAIWFAWRARSQRAARGSVSGEAGAGPEVGAPGGHHHRAEIRTGRVLAAGAGVGVLTGLLGVGGGFVIVPALAATLGLAAPVAIGTSQLVILVNALAGIAGRSFGTASIVWSVGVLFAAGGILGAALGSRLTSRFSAARLSYAFSGVAGVTAVVMVISEIA
jgi:uncharacterized protein